MYQVYIMEVQESCLLVCKPDRIDSMFWDAYVRLLESVDASLLVQNTGKTVDGRTKARLQAVMGDVLTRQTSNTEDFIDQVKADVDVVHKMTEVEARYARATTDATADTAAAQPAAVQHPCAGRMMPIDTANLPVSLRAQDWSKSVSPNAREPTEELCSTSLGACHYASVDYRATTNVKLVDFTVVFSRLNSMSLVYELCGEVTNVTAEQVCEEFPNFDVVQHVSFEHPQLEHFRAFFHQKVWEGRQHLQEKLQCFQQLYDKAGPAASAHPTTTERTRVLSILNERFVLSDDPGKKMKASELISMLCAQLASDGAAQATGFRSRLPGYLLEAGLQKKRLAEGIFYYGVEPTVSTTLASNKPKTLEELEKQRELQFDVDIKHKKAGPVLAWPDLDLDLFNPVTPSQPFAAWDGALGETLDTWPPHSWMEAPKAPEFPIAASIAKGFGAVVEPARGGGAAC